MADLTDEKNRGRAMGLIGAAFGLGFAFGPFLGGIFGSADGEASIFLPGLTAAGFSFCAMLLSYRFMPETGKSKAEKEADTSPLPHWTTVFRTPGQSVLYLMFFVTAIGQSINFAITPFWSNAMLGWTQAQVGFLLAGVGLCVAAIQSLAVGPLFKRFGEVKSLMIGAGIQLAGCAVLLASPASPFIAFIAFPLITSGLTLTFPAFNSLLSQRSDKRLQGTALGLSSGVSALGRVFGPIGGGLAFESFTAETPFFAVAATGLVTILWAASEVRRARG
jgi:DHA1 family tetracycline resistance protein-like MFS transporter